MKTGVENVKSGCSVDCLLRSCVVLQLGMKQHGWQMKEIKQISGWVSDSELSQVKYGSR